MRWPPRNGLAATGNGDGVSQTADVAAHALAGGVPIEIEAGSLEQVIESRSIRQSSRFGITAADTIANLLDRQERNPVEQPPATT